MENNKVLTTLVAIIMVLTLINLYKTFNLASEFAAISDLSTTPVVADTQPTPPAQPNQPAAPAFPVNVSMDDDEVKGDANAPVTIIEFSDYECPFCSRYVEETMPQVVKEYIDTGKVKYVFRDFPLSFHENAQKAAEAAECAGEQGKYWAYHDILFINNTKLAVTNLKQYAKDLNLNTTTFNNCLDNGDMTEEVQKDTADGSRYGVSGTPAFFINGIKLVGAQPFSAFKQIIDAELAKVE